MRVQNHLRSEAGGLPRIRSSVDPPTCAPGHPMLGFSLGGDVPRSIALSITWSSCPAVCRSTASWALGHPHARLHAARGIHCKCVTLCCICIVTIKASCIVTTFSCPASCRLQVIRRLVLWGIPMLGFMQRGDVLREEPPNYEEDFTEVVSTFLEARFPIPVPWQLKVR